MNAAQGLKGMFIVVCIALLGACSTYKQSEGQDPATQQTEHNTKLEHDAAMTVNLYKQTDPTLKKFFDDSAGYAVFPNIAKGAVGIGAAAGDGVVYQNGHVVGYTSMKQGTIGVQLGGQTYSELIFFQNKIALDKFKEGQTEFSAQASAVAAAKGKAANADYSNGVAVFSAGQQGLMFEASIGGQKFSYMPKTMSNNNQ